MCAIMSFILEILIVAALAWIINPEKSVKHSEG